MMAMDPQIYMGLAQVATDYNNRSNLAEQVWAQVATDDEADMNELAEMLA